MRTAIALRVTRYSLDRTRNLRISSNGLMKRGMKRENLKEGKPTINEKS